LLRHGQLAKMLIFIFAIAFFDASCRHFAFDAADIFDDAIFADAATPILSRHFAMMLIRFSFSLLLRR